MKDRSALAEPAVRAARQAPRAEFVRMPVGHYEPQPACKDGRRVWTDDVTLLYKVGCEVPAIRCCPLAVG